MLLTETCVMCLLLKACANDRYTKDPKVYHGNNVVEHFLSAIQKEEHEIWYILRKFEPVSLTYEDE